MLPGSNSHLTTMRAAVWTGPLRMEMREMPMPEIGRDEALVRVGGVGVCGSDIHVWQGCSPDRTPPLILGHEMAGEVMVVQDSDTVQRGDFVSLYPPLGCEVCSYCLQGREALCRHKKPRGIYAAGGFAEYVRMPVRNLLRISGAQSGRADPMACKLYALVEPLATALHFVNSAANDQGPAAILGLGPIGLMILQVAKRRGFSKIAAVENNPNRLEVARRNGADWVVNPSQPEAVRQLEDFFGEDGCCVIWNTAGVAPARLLALRLVRSSGLVVELGLAQAETSVDFSKLIQREIRIAGSYAYSRAEFAAAADLLRDGQLDISDWVTQAPLEDIQSVFEELHQPDTSRVKVVLQP
jgi:2-desacetyl-2-hydroxyethyl bacteriochlorophyllide A dehydrogenase